LAKAFGIRGQAAAVQSLAALTRWPPSNPQSAIRNPQSQRMSEPISIPTAQPPGAWRRLTRNRVAVAAMILLAGIAFVAIFGPSIFPYHPEIVTPHSLHPPTWLPPGAEQAKLDRDRGGAPGAWQHPFGTDMNGRDVFSRVIQGARISLIVGLCGALVSFFVGTTYGLIAGYVGGRTDNVMMRFIEMLHSVPRLIIVIVAIFTFAPWLEGFLHNAQSHAVLRIGKTVVHLIPTEGYAKIIILILCLGLIEWLSMARIVRGQVLALKEQQFVLAARALGQSHARILLRHLLPNLIGVIVVYLTLTIPAVILDESFLSFLGLGINDPQASWGSLLSDGKNVINPIHSYWWLLLFPAAAMSLTLVALNFLGDAIRDALDPRARR
jgi:peptide/nickel transport system permease protein/oligopeptide transport system permease protein